MAISEEVRAELQQLAARYPSARSALLPMLHAVQAAEGQVTVDGIHACADALGITPAEVTGVATFYTMYKRKPVGKHHIGVCTNTMCGLLGGDAVWDAVSERVGCGHNEPSADGNFTLERIECQAACTHAPVMTVDWEYIDDVTPEQALDIIGKLERGEEVRSTRGPVIRDFAASEHTLAFPNDGLADAPSVDDKMLLGLRIAKERGMTAPGAPTSKPASASNGEGAQA